MSKKILLFIDILIAAFIGKVFIDYYQINNKNPYQPGKSVYSDKIMTSKQQTMEILKEYADYINKNIESLRKSKPEDMKRTDTIPLSAKIIDDETLGFYYKLNSSERADFTDNDISKSIQLTQENLISKQCRRIEKFTKFGAKFLYIYLDRNNVELFRVGLDKDICSK